MFCLHFAGCHSIDFLLTKLVKCKKKASKGLSTSVFHMLLLMSENLVKRCFDSRLIGNSKPPSRTTMIPTLQRLCIA